MLCQPTQRECFGPLAPGVHSSLYLITPFTFEVPEGWAKPLEVHGSFNLENRPATGLIAVIPDWAVVSQDECTFQPDPGVGRGVDDLVAWLTEHPGLISTQPQAIGIGDLDARMVDIRKDPAWTETCTGTVNLFTHVGTVNDGGNWDINDVARYRLIFLETGEGHVVTVHVETPFETGFESFLAEAMPIVETFDFSP
jgi:hypothetical protein